MVLKGKIAIIVAGIALMPAAMSFAEVPTDVSGKHYRLDEQRQTAELTYLSYDSLNIDAYRGELEVPTEVQVDGAQYRVTGVTPFACVYCEGLTSVTLPEGVTRIGFGAFSDCPNLAAVSLPSSLTTLGDWAFYRDGCGGCDVRLLHKPCQGRDPAWNEEHCPACLLLLHGFE